MTRRGRRAEPSGIGSVPLDQTEDLIIQLRALTPAPGTRKAAVYKAIRDGLVRERQGGGIHV